MCARRVVSCRALSPALQSDPQRLADEAVCVPRLQWEGVTVHEAMPLSSSNTSLCLCLLVSSLCSKMRMSSMMYIHCCVGQPLCIDAGLLLTKVSDSVLPSAHPVANVAWTPCGSYAMTSAIIPSDYTQRCFAGHSRQLLCTKLAST